MLGHFLVMVELVEECEIVGKVDWKWSQCENRGVVCRLSTGKCDGDKNWKVLETHPTCFNIPFALSSLCN